MDAARISDLLRPYIDSLAPSQLAQISTYMEVLLRWNAKMNLTAVREPEAIVTRHFGESLFLARNVNREEVRTAIDLGSGAGFPGIPLKIYSPHLAVTLIESHYKKTTFLNEVIRKCTLTSINVFTG